MLRPGYFDSNGKKSSGYDYGRKDSYTSKYVDAIANALSTLKKHYRAKKLVVMGYSGGAAIAGVIIGRTPGIVDAAVLVSCL